MAFSMAGGGARGPQINVTPLIDVLLTLIIMFMLVVWTTKDTRPTVKINRDDVRWEDLETRLAQIYLKRAEKVAFVRGDADVDFLYVADVIDLAHHAGVQRVGLLTKGQEVAGEKAASQMPSQYPNA